MNHPIHRVRSLEIVGPYTIQIRFEDDVEQTIDFLPVLAGELYGPLRNLELFNQVRIDPEVKTLVWPSGADFDPATLHDWPAHEAAFREHSAVASEHHHRPLLVGCSEPVNTDVPAGYCSGHTPSDSQTSDSSPPCGCFE
jgi:hypothetical protein